jgi:hypothetical protein
MSYGLPEGDKGAGQVKKGEVVSSDSLPANEQSAEAVVPGVGALHHPTARLALHAAEQRFLAAAPDVRRDPASSNGSLCVGVVVAFVETEIQRPARAARRAHDHSVKRLGHEPLVVDVGAGDLGGQRNAAPVRQDVAFDAAFRAIRRVRAGEVPPFGAFTMALSSEDHFHWMPRLRS